jgi:NCAIR mutase (PurE)-related protein
MASENKTKRMFFIESYLIFILCNKNSPHKLINFFKHNSITSVKKNLKILPFEDIGFATLGYHRSLHKGSPVIIGKEGNKSFQIIPIIKKLLSASILNIIVVFLPGQ